MIDVNRPSILAAVGIVLISFLVALWLNRPQIANRGSQGETIICFGDSITAGSGANQGNDYPSLLSQILGIPVINAGVGGDTTRDALARVDADVLQHNPRMVIIEFSGNDFLRSIPREETLDNLDKLIQMIQGAGAMVVLAEVAAGTFGDAYLEGFQRIAKKRHALLVPNIMKGILFNPSLKSDEIHPNDAGYRLIAERIYIAIEPLLH
jgi:acyl-CoA thioesterase I